MVGSITGFNAYGVAIDVDVMRSGYSNIDNVELNSILMVKNIVMRATNTAHAVDIVVNAPRGCPWFYSISDVHGGAVVLESAFTTDTYVSPLDLLPFWDWELKKLLPSKEFLEKHSQPEWRKGVVIRRMNYTQPQEFVTQFNDAHIQYAGISVSPSAWQPNGFVFEEWQQERAGEKQLMNNYFSPLRTDSVREHDVILLSIHAFIPQTRISQMMPTANFLSKSQEMIQWRYDSLWRVLQESRGQIDMERAWEIVTLLSPDRTPGFWYNLLHPNDPKCAVREGTITLVDLLKQVIHSKGEYWRDAFVELHLEWYFGEW